MNQRPRPGTRYFPADTAPPSQYKPRPPKMSKQSDTHYSRDCTCCASQTHTNQVSNDQTSGPYSRAKQRKLPQREQQRPPMIQQPLVLAKPADIPSKMKQQRKRKSPYVRRTNKKMKVEVPSASDPQQAAQGMHSLSINNDNASVHRKKESIPLISQQYSPNHAVTDRNPQGQQHSGKERKYGHKADVSTKHQSSKRALSNGVGSKVSCFSSPISDHEVKQHPQRSNNVFLSQIGKNTFSAGNYPNTEEKKTEIIDKHHYDCGFKPKTKQEASGAATFSVARSDSPKESANFDQRGHCGLVNLGNTCFMNSALQCMSNTEPLRKYFLPSIDGTTPEYKKDVNRNNPLGMGGAIAKAFGDLLEKMWSGSCRYTNPQELKTQISKFAPRFADFHQQDSQELMAFLLDGLHEDLNRVKEKIYVDFTTMETKDNSDELLAKKSWTNHLLRNNSKIVDIFQGQLMATVTCLCGDVSKICDPFMFLALPIPKERSRRKHKWDSTSYQFERSVEQGKETIDIMDCIRLMTDETTLESWYCTKCKTFVKASRNVDLWKLPEVLIIYFKRFSCTGLNSRDKVTTSVNFPISDLNLNGYAKHKTADDSETYDLFAVSNHHGGIWGGHYTAYAKDSNRAWCKFNDSEVSFISETDVVSEAAYVLFYRRRQCQLYSDPKTRSSSLL